MKILLYVKSLLSLLMMMYGLNAFAQDNTPTTLFHETFGDNSGSARVWSDSYSVKSGVSAVYSAATYSISNAKQGKNTTGSTKSGLNQSTQGTDAIFIVGPLNVENYESLVLTYQWKAASIKANYTTSLSYSTSSTGEYTEVDGTGTGATSFVTRSYTMPKAAQVKTLYLKIVFNTSNAQAIIDEVDLQGVEMTGGSSETKATTPEITGTQGLSFTLSQNITITAEEGAAIYYTTNGDTPTVSSTQYTAPFSISTSTTVKAIAVVEGKENSDVATAIFSRGLATPSFAFATPTKTLNIGEQFTLDASSTDSDGTISYRSGNANIATTSNGVVTAVAVGMVTITATLASTEDYDKATATMKITVIDPNAMTASFDFAKDASLWGIEPTSDNKTSNTDGKELKKGNILLTTTSPSDAVEGTDATFTCLWNADPDQLRVYNGGSFTLTALKDSKILAIILGGARVNSSYLNTTSANGWGTYDSTNKTIQWTGNETSVTISAKGGARIETILVIYSTPSTSEITISDAGYATWVAPVNVTVPSDVEAYTAKVKGDYVSLTSVTAIPAGAAVILKGSGDVSFEATAEEVAALENNDLKAATKDFKADGTQYVLAKVDEEVGFCKVSTEDGHNVIAAGKGYLQIPATVTAKAFLSFEEGTVTAIEGVEAISGDNTIYNLNGQRIAQPVKGINIINGRKLIIK